MKTTYYHVDSPDEIAIILHEGFADDVIDKQRNRWGVYMMDSPTKPDPDYPNNELLEIVFQAQVNLSRWRLLIPEKPAQWNEWVIPARVLNKHARVRLLALPEWELAWDQYRLNQIVELGRILLQQGSLNTPKTPKVIWCIGTVNRSGGLPKKAAA
jgi:hypothetical protein